MRIRMKIYGFFYRKAIMESVRRGRFGNNRSDANQRVIFTDVA